MQYPWTEFFQLGLVVPAFFPEVRERKGPVLEIIRKLAADPFFQALEFSGAEEPTVQRELTKVVRSGGRAWSFPEGRTVTSDKTICTILTRQRERKL